MPPWIYLQGLLTFALTASRGTYILGHAYAHGVWFYFPVLFFLKSPLAFIALLFLACIMWVVAKRRLRTEFAAIPESMALHWRAVCVFLGVFTAACLLSRLTISIRHFSVPLVLLILLLRAIAGDSRFAAAHGMAARDCGHRAHGCACTDVGHHRGARLSLLLSFSQLFEPGAGPRMN